MYQIRAEQEHRVSSCTICAIYLKHQLEGWMHASLFLHQLAKSENLVQIQRAEIITEWSVCELVLCCEDTPKLVIRIC